jgi:hypothetical protein
MKITIILLLLLTCMLSLNGFSQDKEEKIEFENPEVKLIRLQAPLQRIRPAFPVSDVKLYDNRTDTSCLGVLQLNTHQLVVLQLQKGTVVELKEYYSRLIDTLYNQDLHPELHVVLQKLIVSDHILQNNYTEDQKLLSRKLDGEEQSGVMMIVEFYAKTGDDFIPLFRFDSTITGHKSITRAASDYLEQAMTASIFKLRTINWDRINRYGKKLKWENVESFNRERSTAPVLNSPIQKGLYMTFHDFRNNKPVKKEFTVETGKKGDFLYVKNEKGEDVLITGLWGYSDGKDCYIFSANNYFRLHRSGGGFKIYGAKDLSRLRMPTANVRLIDLVTPNSNNSKAQTRSKYYLVKNCLLLDMDSGELF